jgi:hypothetical protein
MILKTWFSVSRPSRRTRRTGGHQQTCGSILDPLEHRYLLSTFFVNNTNDSGTGSLRQAVLDANSHAGADTIKFKQSAEGTITLASQLTLTGDTEIRGPGADALTVSGGGLTRVFRIETGATVTIEKLKIANGSVSGPEFGGGIQNLGTLTLKDSVITGNLATVRGGGIENTGTLTLRKSSVTANRATNSGGGLHNAGAGIAVIDRSTISDNTCISDGAGIRSEVGTSLTITDSTISGNSASGFGTGGIASGATLTIRDSLIAGNTSAAAGIYLMGFSSGGDVLISRSTIRDNGPNGTSRSGVGGIWSYSAGKIRIEDTIIRHNTGSGAGGIWGYGKMEIVNSTIAQNDGGGISALQSATVVDSTISGNTGVTFGGVSAYQLDLIRSTVSGNTVIPLNGSYSAVGGVSVANGHIQNSTISGNVVAADQMQVYHGYFGDVGDATGGVFARAALDGSAVTIENSTIAFNRVANAPADIRTSGGVAVAQPFSFTGYYGDTYAYSATASVRNTIIARNEANIGGPDVFGAFESTGHNLIGVLGPDATGFVSSDLRGSAAIPLDPRLMPLANNGGPTRTHALRQNSPALNAGDNTGAPTTDQRGKKRISHGTIDIGAYEAKFDHDDDHHDNDCHDDNRRFAAFPNSDSFGLAWPNGDSADNHASRVSDRSRQTPAFRSLNAVGNTKNSSHAGLDSVFGIGHSLRHELDWLDGIQN